MSQQPLETTLHTALWRQLGAVIDMLENALVACPDALWQEHLWSVPSSPSQSPEFPPEFSAFWYITFHALVWFDLYLSGIPEEDFIPPPPFPQGELDTPQTIPHQPYTKEQVRTYLLFVRQKCHDQLLTLTDDQAQRPVSYPWSAGQHVTYLELQLYNLRHIQEHVAQLSLFLGQHGTPGEAIDWLPWAHDK
jgi:hypothetical protein